MWCKNCNIETNATLCPICGETTVEDLPIEIRWCEHCKTPIINEQNQISKECPLCGGTTKYISTDLRPVFPEERLLLEVLLDKEPNIWKEKSVWACNNRYFINGKSISISSKLYEKQNVDILAKKIEENAEGNSYRWFEQYIQTFVAANKLRLDYLKDEAFRFVQNAAHKFPEENLVISFSGGKDSTVTADVVVKALSNPSLVHIFGNTTLEFPSTITYAERFRENHPNAIFMIAKNEDQNFYDVCDDIGPPARMMRWCCSMFKTGPITRIINSLYGSQQILTFYGIRKAESVSRSKYNRIEDNAESVKIKQQTVEKTSTLMMRIVWVMTVWAAGAAPTIISEHSFFLVFICRTNLRDGEISCWTLQRKLENQTQKFMWIPVSGKHGRVVMVYSLPVT